LLQIKTSYSFINNSINNLYCYGYQSMSTGSIGLGNKDLISLGFSAFTRNSTPVWQQSAIGLEVEYSLLSMKNLK
jgi:hypothetical protein